MLKNRSQTMNYLLYFIFRWFSQITTTQNQLDKSAGIVRVSSIKE